MKKLSRNKAISYAKQLKNSDNTNLWDVYKNFSSRKESAYNYCIDKYRAENGFNFRVLGHNSMCFTVGWLVDKIVDGQVFMRLRIETAYNSYYYDFDDSEIIEWLSE